MSNKEKDKQYDLIIGLENEKDKIIISKDARMLNTAIIGVKGTRKSSYILPTLARQIIYMGNNTGSTYFVTGIDDGDMLYAIAKRARKKNPIIYIKPSRNAIIYDEIINDKDYDYNRFNQFFDYVNIIRTKSIVIIDAEEYKYHDLSKKFINKILNHIFLSMQNSKTLKRDHMIFFDSADEFLDSLNPILKYGNVFNFSSMLFLESRHYLENKAKQILDIYIRNKIILSNIVKEDNSYFDFVIDDTTYIGDPDKFFYYLLIDNRMKKGIANLASDIDDKEFESLKLAIKKLKKDETVSDNNIPIEIVKTSVNGLKGLLKGSDKIETKDKTEEKTFKESIINNLMDTKEPYNGDKFKFSPTPEQLEYFERNLKSVKNQQKIETENTRTEENLNDKSINIIEEESEIEVNEDIIIKIDTNESVQEDDLESKLATTIEHVIENEIKEQEFTEEDNEEINEKNKEYPVEECVLTEAQDIAFDENIDEVNFFDIDSMLEDDEEE